MSEIFGIIYQKNVIQIMGFITMNEKFFFRM